MSDKTGVNLNRFKELIDNSGVSRQVIADFIGCDVSTITKHYNNDRKITVDYVIKYAEYFKVSTDYLLGLADVPTTDKDLKFICDYTGFKDDVLTRLVENPCTVDLLNDLVPDGNYGFIILSTQIEAYKRQHQNLIDFMEQTINSKRKSKSEKDLEKIVTKYRDLIDCYELTEYQIQKHMVKLLEEYCKGETEKIAVLKNGFDEKMQKLVIEYGMCTE